MTVQILNDATATFPDQAEPDSVDFDILSAISGVLSGCGVTANGTNMTLTVAAGVAVVNGQPVNVGGGTVVIPAASANPRWDIVVVNSAGAQSSISGTPTATNATMPTVDLTQFAVLRAVFIPTSTSALTSGHLVDKSKPVPPSFERILATAGTTFLRTRVTTDTTDRIKVTADGKLAWTSGGNATPTPVLGFDATLAGLLLTGKLGTSASVSSETPLTVTGAASQAVDLLQVRDNTPTVLVKVDSTGQLTAPNIKRGAGAPNGAVTGSVGDMYQQTNGANGATLWIKESGNATNTGWNASGTTSAGLVLGGGQIATGCILEFTASTLPGGFLWCDGSAVSRSTFSALNALYSADGYPWGAGNGSTTFNLPDKRGVVSAGSHNFGTNGTIGDSNRLIGSQVGVVIGERLHLLTSTETPDVSDLGHTHQQRGRDPLGTVPFNPAGGPTGYEVETINGAGGYPNVQTVQANISPIDGAAAHNNVQPTQLSRFIVKY